MMNILNTDIEGLSIIEPKIFRDPRGYFFESFNEREFRSKVGEIDFVQDNESKSSYGVVRGLHFQEICAKVQRRSGNMLRWSFPERIIGSCSYLAGSPMDSAYSATKSFSNTNAIISTHPRTRAQLHGTTQTSG